ncbi:MAG: NAD-dependent epimerase/dehydratase family protein [Isosphaeraceae bacterium]
MNQSFWKDASVLITGGSGFVGRWVGRALAPTGARLHVMDLQPPRRLEVPFEFTTVDLVDLSATRAAIAALGPDVIIHLAGQPGVESSRLDPIGAFASNVTATLHLLEACRLEGSPSALVAVSSNHVYGSQHVTPTREGAPLNGDGTYATSKLCGDVIARTYGKGYGVPVGIARITNSFGGDDHHSNHIVTASIHSALRGQAPVIKRSGRDVKGYLYVKDTVAGLLALAEGVARDPDLHGEAFNFVPDRPISVLELVREVLAVVDLDVEPEVREPGAAHETEHLDHSMARESLDWAPHYSLREALQETVQWYRDHLGS